MEPPLPLITRWVSQSQRDPAALSAAALDGRSLAELVADAAHIAAFVPFVDAGGNESGTWQDVLASDPVILLALIAAVDVEQRTAALKAVLHRAQHAETDRQREAYLRRTLHGIMRLARELDASLDPVEQGRHDLVQQRLTAAIDDILGPRLRDFLAYAAAVERAGVLAERLIDESDWPGERWHLRHIEADLRHIEHHVEHDMIASLLAAAIELGWAFVREIGAIATASRAALDDSLGRDDHAPHIALLLAFSQLFAHAQDRLNDLPQRLVDFHYRNVLRQQPRGSAPDRLFLTVTPQPGAHPVVPEGATFPAGKDAAGAPILFAADAELAVTGAVLKQVRRWVPMLDGSTVSRIDAALFDAGPNGETRLDGAGAPIAIAPALVVTTPVLDLPGGTRRIRVRLGFEPTTAPLADVLGQAMRAQISTAAGWAAADMTVASEAANQITLTLLLDDKAPALAAPVGGVIGPAIRLTIAQDAIKAGAPLALLAGVKLASVAVDVAVKGLTGFTIDTPTGPADPSGFQPFGSQPFAGAAFRIDHPAFRHAPLHRLAIGLDWAAVPAGKYGFAGYYRDYVVDEDRNVRSDPLFTNASFTVRLDGPVRGWDTNHDIPLFAVGDPIAHDVFIADGEFVVASALPSPPRGGVVSPITYFAVGGTGAAAAGAPDGIVVTLSGPNYGFGTALYPVNIAYATAALGRQMDPPPKPGWMDTESKKISSGISGALVAMHMKKPDPPQAPPPPVAAAVSLPNPPWQPVLAGLTIDYAVRVSAEDGDAAPLLFQEAPLDVARPLAPIAGAALLPALPDRPMLDIAMSGVAPGATVSLLARIGPGAGRPVTIEWRYPTGDGWAALPASAILTDASNGLTATGIVRLAIPSDAVPDSDAAIWLRAILPAGTAIPPLLALTPDAVSATREIVDHAAPLPPVPAGTIKRLPGLAGIAAVAQPLAAIGGRDPDAPAELRRRTAERLRHRQRAVTGWDIERLVLADFPTIAHVRALSGGSVVVIPQAAADIDPIRPRAPAVLRDAIAAHLAALSSPFARPQALDPDYVTLDITGRIVVRPGIDASTLLPRDLAAFLSPWAEPGLALPDRAGEDEVRAAIAGFVARLSYVADIDRLSITLGAAPAGAAWRVPALGAVDLVTIALDKVASPT